MIRDTSLRNGKITEALKAAKEVSERNPSRENHFRLGVIQHLAGDARKALEVFRDALRFRTGPRYLLAEIQLQIAYAWYRLGNHTRMQAALRRAYAKGGKPRSAPKFHLTLGGYYFSKEMYSEALREFERAESTTTSAVDRGRAAANRGYALYHLGHVDEGLAHLDRGLTISRRAKAYGDVGTARAMRGAIVFDRGQVRRAMSIFVRAAWDFRKGGDRNREAEALQNAGYMAGELGLWSRSRMYETRAIRLASQTNHPLILIRAYACRATACAYLEEFDQSTADLSRARKLLKGRKNTIAALHVTRAQMRIAAHFELWPEVVRRAKRGEHLAGKAGDSVRIIEFRNARAAAEEKQGHRRVAQFARNSALRLEGLLAGPSPVMSKVAQIAQKLAPSSAPLLLLGEEGTGKLELARKIHAASTRSKGPLIVVPCERLPFPESDLAGHVEGAWSGASAAQDGYVQRAEKGTLVLDRVEELTPVAQRVLVRVLQGWARPVGGTSETPIDVRVIATCRKRSALCPDLGSRLEAAVIPLPKLRERSEDIPDLVRGLLNGGRTVTPEGLVELSGHLWEGNLPELEATVEQLVRFSKKLIGLRTVRRVLRVKETRRHRRRVHKERQVRQMAFQMA